MVPGRLDHHRRLLYLTQRLKFLVALRPGLVGATLTAQQAETYQEISGNRLLLNTLRSGGGKANSGSNTAAANWFVTYCSGEEPLLELRQLRR